MKNLRPVSTVAYIACSCYRRSIWMAHALFDLGLEISVKNEVWRVAGGVHLDMGREDFVSKYFKLFSK